MANTALPPSLDPADLPRVLPGIRHWFRYPLHRHDFHALRDARARRLLGYYSAKPLYGTLDASGRVDRSAGFDGRIAGVFVPSPARSWVQAELFFAEMPKRDVARADGRRNWPAIKATAEHELRERLG
ncbi:MAG: hypothetical protein E6Q77_03650 [Rhizobium sp.]|nr:MAG: hypothetical protein E6Q77_03650 [Rhizobium sp.]